GRDLPKIAREVFLGLELSHDLSVAVDEEDLRNGRSSPLREHGAAAVVNAGIRDAVLALPAARVPGAVLRVDADELHPRAVLLARGLESLRLVNARDAPGGPEVQNEGFLSQEAREVDAAAAVQSREVERGRRRMVSRCERLRNAFVVVARNTPDEEREEAHDECDCERLRRELD